MYLPKISIIIPVYNVEPYIAECLQSVMRQTYTGHMECFMVDDCGTDKSIEIAERLISDYKGPIGFKILHHEHNRGLSAARNTGMKAATGDYVYFLDSDDYVSDDCMEVLARPLQKKEYDMVVGDIKTVGEGCWGRLYAEAGEYEGVRLREACFYFQIYVMAWNKLCNLRFLRQNDLYFYEGILNEDVLWSYRMAKCLKLVYAEKKYTIYYRAHSQGIMGQICKNPQKAATSLYIIVKQIIDKESMDNEVSAPEKVYYINFFFQKYLLSDWGNNARMKELYFYIRRHWDYNPWKLYKAGTISIRQLKKHLFYALPDKLGWWYLYLRTKKHYKNSVN